MNVFWMLLRSWLLQHHWDEQQTQKATIVLPTIGPKGQGIVEYSGALVVAGIVTEATISQVNPTLGTWFVSVLDSVSTSVQQWL